MTTCALPAAAPFFDRVVAIYQLAREFELWLWLCPRCRDARVAGGWAIRVRRLPPPRELARFLAPAGHCAAALDDRTILTCDDCTTAKRPNGGTDAEVTRDRTGGERKKGGARDETRQERRHPPHADASRARV
jgi:hypothetical protein